MLHDTTTKCIRNQTKNDEKPKVVYEIKFTAVTTVHKQQKQQQQQSNSN